MYLKYLTIMSALLITACSNNESYSSKIDRYESKVTEKEIESLAIKADEVSKMNVPEVKLITFRDTPIPMIYKKRYEEMGFDLSTLNFYTPDWYRNQELHNIEQQGNREAERLALENAQPRIPKPTDFMGKSEHVH